VDNKLHDVGELSLHSDQCSLNKIYQNNYEFRKDKTVLIKLLIILLPLHETIQSIPDIMNKKGQIFIETAEYLDQLNFSIVKQDSSRPWGGFYVIDEDQAEPFVAHFFPNEDLSSINISGKLSPKILIVTPGCRLSWQYHYRRAEIWRCIKGPIAVATSLADVETNREILTPGQTIKLQQGERHRLIGLDDWGIVAEIWQHTDANHPSDEDDIVRLQDDFGR
jgi:mannose-6-phosphate isomerase-like protein (cupin superfamily)